MAAEVVERVRGAFRAPRWPRGVGALLGLGAGVAAAGSGVAYEVAHSAPAYYQLGCLVVSIGAVVGLAALGLHSMARFMALLVLGALLAIGVPYAFRSAVLDARGEWVTATVIEVRHPHATYTSSDNHNCELEARGDTFWVQNLGGCGPATRPGDRFEVLRDPEDLVGVAGGHAPITFPVLIPSVGVVLLLLTALGARGMRLRVARHRAA
ncbi:hypothetical protein ACLQ2N_24135 [Streptomyces sp. DT224]|uniref:hypothetical protein n=1 Tax=Streptomyces sp. DT224 TaxID=3393426 RepID=UPI003CF2D7BE